MPNPLRASLAAIEPVSRRPQEKGMEGNMFCKPTVDNRKRGADDHILIHDEDDNDIKPPTSVNGHTEDRTDMQLGVHENHIPMVANDFLSCSAPEVGTTASAAMKRNHKSLQKAEGGVHGVDNNNRPGLSDRHPVVEIDEAPAGEEDGEEEEDLMPIMFHFDTSPGGHGSKPEVSHPFIRPNPLSLRLEGRECDSPEGGVFDRLPVGNGSAFRPIPSARIPRSVSLSPCGSPQHVLSRSPSPAWSMSNLSPATARRIRGRNLSSTRNIDALLGSSPPVRIPRDPVQPTSGSISDVHSEASNDDEEADVFPLEPRQRSSTCPENRSFRRRVKLRNMNRPPTPPPGGADESDVEKQFCRLQIKEKLKIHSRPLPGVPESPGAKISQSTPNLFSD